MPQGFARRTIALGLVMCAAACFVTPRNHAGLDCDDDHPCLDGRVCGPEGRCVSDVPDSGPDAGDDAGNDAGNDAGPDAGPDAGSDAGLDLVTELVAWYRLDGMDGGVTLDSSPFGNHAVVAGNASFQPGKLDQALSLDGIDDFLEAPGSPSLNAATNQLTVAFWVNFQSTGVNQVFLAKLATDGGTHASPFFDYSLHGLTSSAAPMSLRPRFWLRLNGASGQRTISSDTLIAAEGWHHLAGVYDGAAMRIYVDGVLAGGPLAVSGAAIDTHDSPLRIGAHGAGAELVKGSLDDVRIYRRGLTAEEIAALAR